MPNPKQGQKKKDGTTATPKPLCNKHGDPVIMKRFWISGRNEKGMRCMKKRGWICPVCYPLEDSEIEITKKESDYKSNNSVPLTLTIIKNSRPTK